MTGSGVSEEAGDRRAFLQTRWSLVARAARGDEDAEARAAMEEICRDYWYPIYAFARREGVHPTDAEDLVQGFFLGIIGDNKLATADPDRGKLRTYLIRIFRNHMADEMRKKNALKRGGGQKIISIDIEWAEERLDVESADSSEKTDAERSHDRRWALLLLERTLEALEEERETAGHGEEMRVLAPFLRFDTGGQASYEKASGALGWTVNATRVSVFRLRRRFRELLLSSIADTLDTPSADAVEDELRELMAALE